MINFANIKSIKKTDNIRIYIKYYCRNLMKTWNSILILIFVFIGRPQPEVRWLHNGILLDDVYEHNSGDVIENRLLWPSVQRNDLNSAFTCQARNTRLVESKESTYILDLHCKYNKFASKKILYSKGTNKPSDIYLFSFNVYNACILPLTPNTYLCYFGIIIVFISPKKRIEFYR